MLFSAKLLGRGVGKRKSTADLSEPNSIRAGWLSSEKKFGPFRNWIASSSRKACLSKDGVRPQLFWMKSQSVNLAKDAIMRCFFDRLPSSVSRGLLSRVRYPTVTWELAAT